MDSPSSSSFMDAPSPTPFMSPSTSNGFVPSDRRGQEAASSLQPRHFMQELSTAIEPELIAKQTPVSTATSYHEPSPTTVQASSLNLFSPGDVLYGNSYRLREQLGYQNWSEGVYEINWSASALHTKEVPVTISEVMVPGRSSSTQSILRPAMRTLFTVNEDQYGPKLLDVFLDRGRTFFVFDVIEGESLLKQAQRTGPMPEKTVIDCCIAITDILEGLAQRSLVHGLISPEHVIAVPLGSSIAYRLTNVSIIIASGASQFIRGMDPASLSAYMAPEIEQGEITNTTDMYALMATAYHLVTGRMPVAVSGVIPRAQQVNPAVSSGFEQVLMRALHPQVNQRYQQPSDLRRALLDLLAGNAANASSSGEWIRPGMPPISVNVPPPPMPATNSPSATSDLWDLSFPQSVALPPLPDLHNQPQQPPSNNNGSMYSSGQQQLSFNNNSAMYSSGRQQLSSNNNSATYNSGQQPSNNRSSLYGPAPMQRPVQPQPPVQRKQPSFLQTTNPVMRSISAQNNGTRTAFNPAGQATFQFIPANEEEEPLQNLLPNPEELPPITQGNDTVIAYSWFIGILLCLLIITFIAR